MARPRKNAAKGQQLLSGAGVDVDAIPEIPVEEQPYPLPEGWKWVRGRSILGQQESERPVGEYFNYIDIDAIDNQCQKVISPKRIETAKAPSRASRKLHMGDTVFSLVRPYLRNIAYIDADLASCIASTGFFVCTPAANVHSRYLFWLMTSDYVVNGLNKFMKGDNSPSIRKGDIEEFLFPLPPLEEQQRIVANIESLFSKLDAAKEKAQAVLDGAETRKAAILHKAFTGDLTAQWRAEHIVITQSVTFDSPTASLPVDDQPYELPTTWQWVRLGSAVTLHRGVSYKKHDVHTTRQPNDCLIMRGGNIAEGEIRLDVENVYVDRSLVGEEQIVKNLDIVIVTSTGSTKVIGRAGISFQDYSDVAFGAFLTLARVKENLNKRYVSLYFQTSIYRNRIKELASGVNINNVRAEYINGAALPLPPLQEQQEIVRILDELLAKEQQIQDAAETVLAKIDLMKKAVLAKAFRGELSRSLEG